MTGSAVGSQAKNLLEVTKLEVVYFKAIMAIQGVSFKVPEGSIVAILGVNGAGKTTTLRAISGFLSSDNADITDGVVEFDGERLNGKVPHEIARRGVILVPEREKIFVTLTVAENLLASASAGGRERKEAFDEVFGYFPVLKDRWHQVAGYLSGGERQMLAISQALVGSPKLLMVDELSLGLSPLIVTELMGVVQRLRDERGMTILLVEQNAVAALRIADYCYVMENGRVVYEGMPEMLSQHEDVREFYLGLGEAGVKDYRDVKQYRRTRRWWT
jgi:branched-chain amino acid transport system ATP-binding protein